jgi:hypothetical protein
MIKGHVKLIWVTVIGFCFLVGCDMLDMDRTPVETDTDLLYVDKPLPPAQRKRVLVLHSYHPEMEWVRNINKGIKQGLLEERFDDKKNMILENFFMDTKRKTKEAWKYEVAQMAMNKIKEWQPHLVIATDDNAQAYVDKFVK